MRRVLGLASLVGLLLASSPVAAHGEGAAALTVVVMSLLPAVGPEVRFRTDSWVETRFVLAWPFQIPLGPPAPSSPHRVVIAPEFVSFSSAADGGNEDTFLRFRAGYRYVHREVFIAGLGATFDVESTVSVSPELGFRTPGYAGVFGIARVERSLIENDPLRANLLVGFSFY
jgi:hypothetical protein